MNDSAVLPDRRAECGGKNPKCMGRYPASYDSRRGITMLFLTAFSRSRKRSARMFRVSMTKRR